MRTPNLGRKGLNDIKTLIGDFGFEFGMSLTEEDIKKLKIKKEEYKEESSKKDVF